MIENLINESKPAANVGLESFVLQLISILRDIEARLKALEPKEKSQPRKKK